MNNIRRLLDIMAQLRDPDTGCPWDLKQDLSTLTPYILEEAYEVVDAIERNDTDDIRDELGDLLLQVVFSAQLASEEKKFDFEQIAKSISDKLVRRHPHVFGDEQFETDEQRAEFWEQSKVEERKEKQKSASDQSALDSVTVGLPSLSRAQKLQKRAAQIGFDWPEIEPVYGKISEELQEVREASPEQLEEEIGDLLFSVVNLSRHLKVDAEEALRKGNLKFVRRFQYIEDQLDKQHLKPEQCSLQRLDELWDQAKQSEINIP
ncbi:MAG: nucleoside triphosphate pyrophosphohydrolase [Proteobacteria bacterium]|nr:nucleoside triphosphate pyrophosphohydrolase [Pseudomonadota bacterium]